MKSLFAKCFALLSTSARVCSLLWLPFSDEIGEFTRAVSSMATSCPLPARMRVRFCSSQQFGLKRDFRKLENPNGRHFMYYNVFGEKVSRRRFKEMCEAAKNRRELIAAGLTSRRDLLRMGLLTAGGMLVAKSGLSARAQSVKTNQPASSGSNSSPGTNQNCVPGNQTASPKLSQFVLPLPIIPLAHTVSSLTPTPTENPNTAAGEVRAAPHQAPQIDATRFPVVPGTLYQFTQKQFTSSQFSPELPPQ